MSRTTTRHRMATSTIAAKPKLKRADALEMILTNLLESAEAACRAHAETFPDHLSAFYPAFTGGMHRLRVRCKHTRDALKGDGLAKFDAAGMPTDSGGE